jgi:hypothetical protein
MITASMKTASLFLVVALGLPAASFAASSSSTDYSVVADVIDSGGATASSADYGMQGSAGAAAGIAETTGVAGFAKHGFLAQIYERVGFGLVAAPATVDEAGTRQILGGDAIDDGTLLSVVPGGSITWSILSGPLTGISATGLVTAGIVAQNTPASVQGMLGGDTATLPLTVLNTIADNFGSYASDGLPDDFQVQYFGFDNPLAAPNLDVDGDGQTNYFEWVTGLSPISGASRFETELAVPDGQMPVTFGPCFPDRTYTLLYSLDLSPGSWQTIPGAIVLPIDANGFCTIIDPSPGDERRFYRVEINFP